MENMNADEPRPFSQLDDYGFFLDLESNTLEQDQVEYYVVTTRTHYEVRRKISKPTVITKPAELPIQDSFGDSTCFQLPEKENETQSCTWNIIYKILRFPRDLYYSCVVCSVTISCIYLVMNC